MPVCEMDVRVGGRFRWVWQSSEDGSRFGFHGELRVVDPHSRLVHTEVYDPGDVGGTMGEGEAVIDTRLTEENGVTTMVTTMDFGPSNWSTCAMTSPASGIASEPASVRPSASVSTSFPYVLDQPRDLDDIYLLDRDNPDFLAEPAPRRLSGSGPDGGASA